MQRAGKSYFFSTTRNYIQYDPHDSAKTNKAAAISTPIEDKGVKGFDGMGRKIGWRANAWVAQFRLMFNAIPGENDEVAPISPADTVESGNNFYLRVRNSSKNLFYPVKIEGATRTVGLNTSTTGSFNGQTAQFDAGKWIDITAVCVTLTRPICQRRR